MVSKIELRAQIKLLRAQMDNLEVKCQEREDRLFRLLETLAPFMNALSPEVHDQILKSLD